MSENPTASKSNKIKVKKRGNHLGFKIFELMIRGFGLKGAYLLLEIVSTHYLIFDREAVASGLSYIEKRFPNASRVKHYWQVHRLFVNQGRQLIDRFVVARRPDYFKFKEIVSGVSQEALNDPNKGLVMLLSHFGNWQVALRQMGHLEKDICIVMRPEDNPSVKNSLQIGGNEAKSVKIIDPEGEMGGVVEMMQALKQGKLVCLMGDRGYGFDTVTVPFLGAPASFPYGGFYIAAATNCPVLALFSYKTSERNYVADISSLWHPTYDGAKTKKEQLSQWVEKYICKLEEFVKKHPFECFLFHDVWHQKRSVDEH